MKLCVCERTDPHVGHRWEMRFERGRRRRKLWCPGVVGGSTTLVAGSLIVCPGCAAEIARVRVDVGVWEAITPEVLEWIGRRYEYGERTLCVSCGTDFLGPVVMYGGNAANVIARGSTAQGQG